MHSTFARAFGGGVVIADNRASVMRGMLVGQSTDDMLCSLPEPALAQL